MKTCVFSCIRENTRFHVFLYLVPTFPPMTSQWKGSIIWLLCYPMQDSVFDFRLFGESGYNEPPPKLATWEELAR